MKITKTIWIPAIIAAMAAVLLVVYYYYMSSSHSSGEFRVHTPEGGARHLPAGGLRRSPGGEGLGAGGEIFKTLGTIAVFLGASSFSWFWFKKKLKSPSIWVRRTGRLLHSVHKLLGWATLIIVAVHGTYFLITKSQDNKIYTGLAGFAILLTLVGYGFFINKIRNKWTRTVHRSLGLLWVPVLLLHAGGTAIAAVIASLAVWLVVWLLERTAATVRSMPADR
jgi:hypothetical protein